MLEAMKIRSPGFIQGYHLSIDNSVGGKIIERLWFAKTLADFEINDIAALPPLFCYNS
jgi:hypothetical protein